ncbi:MULTISPECIES: adenosylmethionine--8-amino-7-oxononanoate transaminase [unclassified Prochlorococcus]|uniref:adenosylmethionine--8-amino-7-oxononanoate transaminase n=1 Tax=unclassified Prochlorococcus TaxID=2627481 RepID=UPI00053392C6|nr:MULTISPECIES: adenosylmethionine--8-amino-7-oxononanoate transaminase [unclassified Prochlorococcus]KGG14766.1 Adenosylmethionine-8-amino-7-oxononanoate aminotransferase [Prochlorococcus sp. MIT 0602]KGG15802.1 Adenosylmethionine-8-amino-7-oxononanoate aminotransferase [Prochlorococcus sp. MIT 0603]
MNSSKNNIKSFNQEWHPNIWPPFTQITLSQPPQKIIRGKGSLLYRKDGSSLIDAISSWWVTLHGHSDPFIAEAIYQQANQLEQVIFADFTHEQAEKLSERLSRATGLQRLFFSDNGSTAVEVALKLALQWWHNKGEARQQIIAFEGAYHGDTFGAMAVGERNLFNEPFEKMLFPVSRVPWPATWWNDAEVEEREEKAIKKLEELLETPTAAVILEPLIQGAGGMTMVRSEFLEKVQRVVRQSTALLIADEVMVGFGRSGSLFASQRAKIFPDLMALSKGLTGGSLPMGVTMASEKIFECFINDNPRNTFWHGHSFTANPLGCAAANASLDLLERNPNSYRNFESRHLPHLKEIANHPKVKRVRLTGTIAAFELKTNNKDGYLNVAGKSIKAYALERNVFIRPLGNVIYLLPPLCITNEQLSYCYSVIQSGLDNF